MDFSSLYDSFFSGVSDLFSGVGDVFSALFGGETAPAPEPIIDTAAKAAETASNTVAPVANESSLQAMLTKVNEEYAKGQGNFVDWLKSLSDADKMQIGLLIKGGAAGALATRSQNSMLEQRNREREQDREDKIRRGHVNRMPEGTFSARPVPGGLIEGSWGG